MTSRTTVAIVTASVALWIGCEGGPPGAGYREAQAVDLWATPAAGVGTAESAPSPLPDLGGGGGGGLQQMLQTVIENAKKPGPYEAPERGPGYASDKPHVGVLELGGAVVEREAYSLSLVGGGDRGTELRALAHRLDALAADPQITGLLVRFGGLAISLPDAVELRAMLHAFRAKQKRLTCFTEGASGVTYLVMTACDQIALAPLGEIVLAGPAAMPIHVKPLLDRLGVQADFIHVGAYKGAAEPLTLDAPSREMMEVLGQILDRHYDTAVDIVAADRAIPRADVVAIIDQAMFDAAAAKAAHLVDEVGTWEAVRDVAGGDAWIDLALDDTAGGSAAALVRAMQFLGMSAPAKPSGPHVALVYAVGDVVDGDGDGLLGARSQIASGTLVAALRAFAADDTVKGVVVRIDSGGGSALASEQIWHAMSQLAAKKPVVVSMSDVAASGGYYIAAPATKIFALPDTLTGSIGVVGGKLALGPALDRLGVKSYPMGRGKHATMYASLNAWTPEERALVERSMAAVYEVFVARVAAGRHTTPDKIQPIAQGHVWTGTKAKELGLVDELGGLDAAVAEARTLAHVDAATDLEVYPPAPTLRDFVHGFGGVRSGLGAAIAGPGVADELDRLIGVVPGRAGTAVRQLLRTVASFAIAPVQARAFIPPLAE